MTFTRARDLIAAAVVAGVLVISLIFVAVNLLVDLLYAFLDPRVKLA